mgnify:FL=1
MSEQMFQLHLVSDATGETLEGIVKAALVQFENVEVEKHLWPLVRTPGQMTEILDYIEKQPGLVFYTLVNEKLRSVLTRRCAEIGIPHVSVLDPVIDAMGSHLGARARGLPGRQHEMDAQYFHRIDALHYTMAHDDGQLVQDLEQADIILVGVSRTSKTPTSIYLANKGFKTANVPFVPGVDLPPELGRSLKAFIVGLTASPERLVQVRANRLRTLRDSGPNLYVDEEMVREEVINCRRFCRAHGWPIIDVTRRSIEETAATILRLYMSEQESGDHAAE